MNLLGKFLAKFHAFEDTHPKVKLAAEVGSAIASHLHGGGTIDAIEAVVEGLRDVIAEHKAAAVAQAAE